MDEDQLFRFSDLAEALAQSGFVDGQDFVIDMEHVQWQDYPRVTSKYSPNMIRIGRNPFKPGKITLPPEYLNRIIQRFTQTNLRSPEYIHLMANAHLCDIVSKLAFIKSARNGKVVTTKDIQLLFDMENIKTIQ